VGDRIWRRISIVVVVSAAASLALAPGVSAKKPAGAGPVVTASDAATMVGPGFRSLALAAATCPKRTFLVGHGFSMTQPTSSVIPVHTSNRLSGQRRWLDIAYLEVGSATSTAVITTYVYCRRGAPKPDKDKLKPARSPVPSASFVGPIAVSTCPKRQTPLSGGFESPGPPFGNPGEPLVPYVVTESLREGKRSWRTSGISYNAGGEPSGLTSQAVCVPKQRVRRASRTVIAVGAPNAQHGSVSSVTAKCPRRTQVLDGGYSVQGLSVGDPGSLFVPYESVRAGARTWRVSAVHFYAGPATLTAVAYCR
jgi:hypothetical protein